MCAASHRVLMRSFFVFSLLVAVVVVSSTKNRRDRISLKRSIRSCWGYPSATPDFDPAPVVVDDSSDDDDDDTVCSVSSSSVAVAVAADSNTSASSAADNVNNDDADNTTTDELSSFTAVVMEVIPGYDNVDENNTLSAVVVELTVVNVDDDNDGDDLVLFVCLLLFGGKHNCFIAVITDEKFIVATVENKIGRITDYY